MKQYYKGLALSMFWVKMNAGSFECWSVSIGLGIIVQNI